MKIQHRIAQRCGACPGRAKKISKKEIPARTETDLRSPAKKKRFQVDARKRMTSASGFTWFAREP